MGFTNEVLKYHPSINEVYKRGVDNNKPEIMNPIPQIDHDIKVR